MSAEIPRGGTEWVFNALTFKHGTVADIVSVASLHTLDPNTNPVVADFTQEAELVDTVDHPLWRGTPEIATRIGARVGALTLAPGDWQRHILISTADEDIIRKPGTVTIL